ncbi:TIGR03808 family TAT-translocated repetitive protein [Rhizobium sp. AQ_MP]|uniref:TIGR03808 family TAT-translocated repetitive protein n=1 Tax=Rhizobium sp. AQ_MP TaxID=2761536 RepID=UPI00163A0D73|nr:TIGR03808 family TAT-translocated repetitive protein [Rhizobium sp. AQ_MP]MBC2775338.1 TIGR03808 family TAT-translocated repetitive protein [Rhizobium sp. AQ_MP]
MPSRRSVMIGLGGLFAMAGWPGARASAQTLAMAELRGGFDAAEAGILPGTEDDQSRKLQDLIDRAAAVGQPVFLPAGTYEVANLELRDGSRIVGVPGLTRLVYRGDGHLIAAQDIGRVSLSGITFDGANRWLADYTEGLLAFRSVDEAIVEDCEIVGSRKCGIYLARSGGRIEGSRITGAADAGIWAIEGKAFSIRNNRVFDCGNGGILVHRWTKGEDGTVITGNRVARIGATNGGTGQFGNGINVFRADNVMVTDNHVSDCAFSAIRANSASNITIGNNQAYRSGETAVYAEFEFEAALITNNLIDGAAIGISVANFDHGGRLSTVSNNIIRRIVNKGPYVPTISSFGFGISVEADTLVSGNLVEGAETAALAIGWGPYLRNVIVTDNILRDSVRGMQVSVVEGAGRTVIRDNILSGVSEGAIFGYRWKERVTEELIDDASSFAHLSISGNVSDGG